MGANIATFWPAWFALPALRPMVFALMARVAAVELGSILITKLPPGKMIEPHSDAGNWAPEFYNCKTVYWPRRHSFVAMVNEQKFDTGTIWTF